MGVWDFFIDLFAQAMKDLADKTEIELYVINKVREMRLEKGISQADLAHKLDLSVGFIGNVESVRYRAKYNLNHLNKLAKIFECSFADFFPKNPI